MALGLLEARVSVVVSIFVVINFTLAFVDRSKKSNKNNKKFEYLKNLPCPFHKNAKHTAAECRQL